METEIIIDGIKIKAIKEEKTIFSGRDSGGNLIPLTVKIIYTVKGINKYKKFRLKDYPYKIEGKIFYRTEANPPEWEFKFIEC